MKDKYSSMADEETAVHNDNFIIGFSNPGADSAVDKADGEGGVTVIGYRPIELETNQSLDGENAEKRFYSYLFKYLIETCDDFLYRSSSL